MGISCICSWYTWDTHTTAAFENYQKNMEDFAGAHDSKRKQARETRVKHKKDLMGLF